MPNLIWFEWEKCPDGYTIEILEPEFLGVRDERKILSGSSASERAPAWVHKLFQHENFNVYETYFVAKSDRVLRFRPLEGADAAFMELSECWESDSNILQFVDNYGLLLTFPSYKRVADDWSVDEFHEVAGSMTDAVESWQEAKRTGDFDGLIHAFNTSNMFEDPDPETDEEGPPVAALQLQLRRPTGGTGLPILSVVLEDLKSALWLQFAQAVSSSTQLRRCAVCPTWFVYGTGTGRRKSAHYCSDRCRKAAHRRQKSTKTSD